MSTNKNKPDNDIDALVEHLRLGPVRYREFGNPRNVISPTPPAAARPAAAAVATPAATAPAVDEEAKVLRSVSAASPLAFTFERLRRQAIGTSMRKPYLTLTLPERHTVQSGAPAAPRERLLQAVFAELDAHGQSRLQKQR